MAKLCECCGNKNNSFQGDSLQLEDDKILCSKCAQPIREDLNKLFYAETQEEFDEITGRIIGRSKTLFDEATVQYICNLINKRSEKTKFHVSERAINSIAELNIKEDEVIMDNSTSSSGMFRNIGGKIKGLAKAATALGIIAYIVIGIIIMCIDDDIAFVGVLVMIVGAFISWISSFILYGFGQLIENSDMLVKLSKHRTLNR